MSKYDWCKAPAWVNFIFKYNDIVWGSNFEPRICELSGNSWRYSGDGFKCKKIKCDSYFHGDWRDSLEERPK